jgi:hypothetical protein
MTLAATSVPARSRAERLRGPVLGVAALGAGALALHVRDPHVTHSWGVCPLYALTGVYCPGCGGLRSVNDLTDGHLGQAASSNLLLVLAIPCVLVVLARWGYAAWTGRPMRALPAVPRAAKVAAALLVVAFTVARNLPGSWLAPG